MKDTGEKAVLKRWEVAVVICAGALFLSSFFAYVTDFPLRNYLFGLSENDSGQKIGHISQLNGSLKREVLGQSEFKSVENNAEVFQEDTLVTGNDARATLTLNDGSLIDLGPQTMVKLEGENRFSLTGVSRTTHIEVVNGQVSGKAATAGGSRVVIESDAEEIDVDDSSSSKIVKASNTKPVVAPPKAIAAKTTEPTNALGQLLDRALFRAPPPAPAKPAPPAPDSPLKKPTATPTLAPIVLPPIRPQATPSPAPSPIPSPSPSRSPSPSPSPTPPPEPKWSIWLESPPKGAKLSISRDSVEARKTITLGWQLKVTANEKAPPKPVSVTLKIWKLDENNKHDEIPLLEKIYAMKTGGRNEGPWTAPGPGNYEWSVSDGKKTATDQFSIDKDFDGIQLYAPQTLIDSEGGKRLAEVRISWKPMTGASKYILNLGTPGQSKLQKPIELQKSEFKLVQSNRNQKGVTYEVIAVFPNGFFAHSSQQQIAFDLVAPKPTTPADRTEISESDTENWEGGILLTWQMTGVSQGYIIEIASTADFAQTLIRKPVQDNFFIFKPSPKFKDYWWRVSAIVNGMRSPPSVAFRLSTKNLASGDKGPQQ